MKTALGRTRTRPASSDPAGRVNSRRAGTSGKAPSGELADLRVRLAEAESALRAIRGGEVDAVVVPGPSGPRIFTLQGAEHAYRVLIESMSEGALTLTANKTILYANQSFARLVKCPLEQILGSSFRRFLPSTDRARLRALLKQTRAPGFKLQVRLIAGDGALTPAQISVRPLPSEGGARSVIGMVVTDLTEAERMAERLRALTHRVVDVLEAERGRVALELHDNITQHLCAILFRSQALAENSSARSGPAKREAEKIHEMLGRTTEAVERISRDLRPGVLEQLGLATVLRTAGREFTQRTGIRVRLICHAPSVRLPPAIELALLRILQETFSNVEEHGRAGRVIVRLRLQGAAVRMVVRDDGIGFDPDRRVRGQKGIHGLGLLNMRERATYVGGDLEIKSVRGAGTEIAVTIPVPPNPSLSRNGDAAVSRRAVM